VYADQDAHDRALLAVQPIAASSPWYRPARFRAGLSQLRLKRPDDAFATFKSLADARPTPHAWNNLGVAQMRRTVTPQGGEPTFYFNKAAEADRTDPDYFFNLGYAYWMARDAQAAIYWLREALRRDPTDGDAHFVLGTALAAAGHAAEANREKELARRLSSTYVEWEKRPGTDAVPRGLERVKKLFGASFRDYHFEHYDCPEYTDTPEQLADLFIGSYGPTHRAYHSLPPDKAAAFRADLLELYRGYVTPIDGKVRWGREYIITLATRA